MWDPRKRGQNCRANWRLPNEFGRISSGSPSAASASGARLVTYHWADVTSGYQAAFSFEIGDSVG
jgi:hypothetical protein